MTLTEKLARASRWRIGSATGFSGMFTVPLDGELWWVVLSENDSYRHLSVANAQHRLIPTHLVISQLRKLFFSDDAHVVMRFKPANEDHYCQHLWQFLDWDPPLGPDEKNSAQTQDAAPASQQKTG